MKRQTDYFIIKELDHSSLENIVDYWTTSNDAHLNAMGVDLNKVPSRASLWQMIGSQIGSPDEEKKSLAFVAYMNNEPIGHCNVNRIQFGEEAYMHLHIWKEEHRRKGLGSHMVKASIPLFFERLKLKRLYCEPYSKNEAPNKALIKLGFKYKKSHRTIPGSINFEQEVNTYTLKKSDLLQLESTKQHT